MAGVSAPSPLVSAMQRARAQEVVGDAAGARRELEHALRQARTTLSKDDPDVLTASLQLGVLLRADGDPSSARRVLEDAYAAGLWRFGDGDPLMVLVSFEIAQAAEELANRHEARRAFRRVVAHGPAALGEDHPAVRQARSYLGGDPPTVGLTLPPGGIQASAPPYQQSAPPVSAAPYQHSVPPYRDPAPPLQSFDRGERRDPYLQERVGVPRIAPEPRPRRGAAVAAMVLAGVAAVAAIVALVVVVTRPSEPGVGAAKPAAGAAPAAVRAAPAGLRLVDEGTNVTLDWQDPANGTVSFFVTMGHRGEQLTAMANLGPGTVRYQLHALNPQIDYCFAVVAVYAANDVAISSQVCTNRSGKGPRPTASR